LINFYKKWKRGKKTQEVRMSSLGVNIGPPCPYYAPKSAQKGRE